MVGKRVDLRYKNMNRERVTQEYKNMSVKRVVVANKKFKYQTSWTGLIEIWL